jgi:hypothetical protein
MKISTEEWYHLILGCSGHPCAQATCAPYIEDPNKREVFHTRQWHLPPASPCLAGCATIARGQAGAASGMCMLQWLGSHCDITTKSVLIGQTT